MDLLSKITIHGFKSIKNLDDFELKPINVLIGANGSGKSNFVSFFRLLSWITAGMGNLQTFILNGGGASTFLHDGAEITPQIESSLEFSTANALNEYFVRLFHAAGDTLIFAEEKFRFTRNGEDPDPNWTTMNPGSRESLLIEYADRDANAKFILHLLKKNSCISVS